MRILGIDYGGRRIGLAISDPMMMIAHGLPTLKNESEEQVLKELGELIREREVDEFVLGLPRNMNDTLGPQAQKVMQFAEKLAAFGKPVRFVDERLTTERARRAMDEAGFSFAKQKRNVDRMAAQFILQLYLDLSRSKAADDGRL
jgi:putative holliday junction resolvase